MKQFLELSEKYSQESRDKVLRSSPRLRERIDAIYRRFYERGKWRALLLSSLKQFEQSEQKKGLQVGRGFLKLAKSENGCSASLPVSRACSIDLESQPFLTTPLDDNDADRKAGQPQTDHKLNEIWSIEGIRCSQRKDSQFTHRTATVRYNYRYTADYKPSRSPRCSRRR